MIETLITTNRANEGLINALMGIGALYVDETGIHASEPGIYHRIENIPATDRKSEQG